MECLSLVLGSCDPIPTDLLFPHAAVISPNLSLGLLLSRSTNQRALHQRGEEREDKGENPVTSQVINGARCYRRTYYIEEVQNFDICSVK